jgi:hypothetical protein
LVAALYATVPVPPPVADVMVSQLAELDAVHAHAVLAVTDTLPLFAAAGLVIATGDTTAAARDAFERERHAGVDRHRVGAGCRQGQRRRGRHVLAAVGWTAPREHLRARAARDEEHEQSEREFYMNACAMSVSHG